MSGNVVGLSAGESSPHTIFRRGNDQLIQGVRNLFGCKNIHIVQSLKFKSRTSNNEQIASSLQVSQEWAVFDVPRNDVATAEKKNTLDVDFIIL